MMNRLQSGPFSKGRRRQRSGQTLVEYALIMAYIAVVALQVMDTMSMYTTETLIEVDCDLLMTQVRNPDLSADQNRALELAAILNFLSNYNYGHYSDSEKATIFLDCYEHMANIVANT